MRQMSAETLTQVMLWMSVLIGLVIVGVLIVQRFRGSATQKGSTPQELIANFEEMRSRGDITDADYRRIKSVLGDQLQSKLKDGKDKL
jgi:uncharacterized membrane protein